MDDIIRTNQSRLFSQNEEDHYIAFYTGARIMQQFERTGTFKKYGAKPLRQIHPRCSHLPDNSDEYWICYIRHQTFHLYHPTGT